MADTIRNELKKKYLAEGGLEENLTNDSQTIAGMINAMNNPGKAIPKIGVAAEEGETELFGDGIKVKDMQKDVVVSDGKITGKLFKLTEGSLVDRWGEGYFMALKFTGATEASVTSCLVGMNPSVGSGLVELKGDPDQNGAFKVSNKGQAFEVQQTVVTTSVMYDCSGLVLA